MTTPIDILLKDEAATKTLGEDLALAVKIGDCLALSGDLGAGKSTLARALLRALADDDELEVPSPTFTLVQSYPLRIPAAHFDLYRLSDVSELDELGFDEALSEGICLVEWPERAESALPKTTITLSFTHEGDGRRVIISGYEAALSRIGRSLSIRNFLDFSGYSDARRRHLSGDASARAYETISTRGRAPMILMDAPRHKPGPILEDGKYYQQLAHIAEDCVPFVAIDRDLRAKGFSAPEIYESDLDAGILLIEDLGRDGVLDADGKPIAERYIESVRMLAALHAQKATPKIAVGNGIVHTVPDFDRRAMKIETRLLLDWYLPWKRGEPASSAERDDYAAVWDGLIDLLATSETNLLLRDFHSPNIIWREQEAGLKRIGLIDFQDAMIGPTAYDVASLTQDARVTIEPALTARMLEAYMAGRQESSGFDRETFLRDWHIMSAQRNCKLVGIWVRLMQRDGKPGYMKHMPRTFAYLETALTHPALAPLKDWCVRSGLL
ncbi:MULTISPECIES: tRNA (adenosine(37)-N6)-threonylcarbamoyltransferase complex ATPase subunit type 1 TsaE [unclassified Rhizobium]|uniref:tRNA (adenosine(37)-N6)-threonylcarbamoyltransferase complex ATPase subunit type 1 TsaE n=1 Tax=unclassified Rhizobium TaxID=2613769 RepID=UPI0006FD50EA|nr:MULTISPECIES: tRNA (adenosine(37)-N6)-threonylcarbamoyltransferase complex ATPase subunit type 1 TsaE [unclassified Rhizobium]KQV35858.1 tRNA threonylcarbamoyladenosine biosynthesis protein TsaE [Rhizobium sp. Root1212]KRD25965.1 tRNA threonylcarbamoyladenosine biosynthesis protein TsaE [Rhizobium sp. Root268]